MKIILVLLLLYSNAICNAELRTWTAVNGKEVEAEFVSNEKEVVKLKLKSGKVFEVPIVKLSNKDREHIQAFVKSTLNSNDNTQTISKYNIDMLELLYFSNNDPMKKTFANAIDWNNLDIAANAEGKKLHFNKLDPKIHVVIDPNKSEPFSGWLKAKGTFNFGELESKESIILTEFKNGIKHGVECTWHPNGKKRSLSYSKNGYAEGKFTGWYETGNTQLEMFFEKGKQNGLITDWYKSGKKHIEVHAQEGIKNGMETKWYENGQKLSEQPYVNGKISGLCRTWHMNGNKKTVINLKDDNIAPNGVMLSWYENGQQRANFKFQNGIPIKMEKWDEDGNHINE